MLLVELNAIMLELSSEEPEKMHTGATGSTEVGDDVGHREGVVDSLGAIAEAVVGAGNEAPVPTACCRKRMEQLTLKCQSWSGRASIQESILQR